MENPQLVEVTRGGLVESWHRGAFAVARDSGELILSGGDADRPVFARSAIKLLQALPLVESGAADAYDFNKEDLALACASHGGEPRHVDVAAAMLRKAGLRPSQLECGAHAPLNESSARAMLAASATPGAIHNNCSGKHAGMLATALHLGEPTTGYVRAEHPVQRRVEAAIVDVCDHAIVAGACGIDGCSVPTFTLPVAALATGHARIVTGKGLAPARKAAASRLLNAATAEPFLVAGTGRFCTSAMQALAGKAYLKVGAEGVYCGALLDLGIGIALKIDDGTWRAAEVAMAAILMALMPAKQELLRPMAVRTLHNVRGTPIGEIRPAAEFQRILDGVAT